MRLVETIRMNTIFCMPYAGGAASAYAQLKKYAAAKRVELVPIEYAGRASRMAVPAYRNLEDAAKDCYEQIKKYFSRHYVQNYGLFGHSMGSWVVYEILRLLQEKKELRQPDILFLSANTIPQREVEEKLSDYPDSIFWEDIYRMGGLEKELYESSDFRDYILPIIKNDYRILEEYAGANVKPFVIDSDICVMGGRMDTISEEEYLQWKQCTARGFDLKWFQGEHFYFREEGMQVVDYFQKRMQLECEKKERNVG